MKEASDSSWSDINKFPVQFPTFHIFTHPMVFLTFSFLAIPDAQKNIFLVKYHNYYADITISSQLAVFAKIEHNYGERTVS